MTIRRFLPLVILLFCGVARADLAADIKTILKDKYLAKVELSISVTKLGKDAASSASAYRFESEIPLIPASNLKVLTTSAFLDHAGADFKFRTRLMAKDGDVYLIGDGDPTLGDVEMLKKVGWDVTTVFATWAAELHKHGITSVRNVFVDDSVFDQQFIPRNWQAKNLASRYSAQVGGVNLNANCVDVWIKATTRGQPVEYLLDPDTRYVSIRNVCVTGNNSAVGITRTQGTNELVLRGEVSANLGEPASAPIHDPPMFAATVLAETLARNGVSVQGKVSRDLTARERIDKEPAGWTMVAALETKLSTVLDRANKDSMNLYAECLCKRLGNAVSGQSGTWENGTAAVGEFLKRVGVPATQFHLDDGSGLSKENAVSAETLVKVLTYDYFSKNKEIFMNSLAVAGADGTFKGRFKGNLNGRVFGKSGYVDYVSAISGYLHAHDDNWYAFSILMNNCPYKTNDQAKKIQERIVAAIDENAN